jgi:hypothetical protein
MDNQTFKVVFKGKIVRDVDLDTAQAHFAKLFKLSPEKAAVFFDGKTRVLKKALPMEKASHFRSVLKKAGIRVSLVKNEEDPASTKKKEWQVSEPGVVILRPVQPPETHIETSHIKLSMDLGQLEEKADIDTPEVDIDHIRIDENADQPIVEPEEVEIPEFNTDDFTTAEVGAIMVDAKKVSPPDIPVDGLEFDDSDEPIVKKVKHEEPEVDISNISLEVED